MSTQVMRRVVRMILSAAALSASCSMAQVTEIIDWSGDGTGNTLDHPYGIAVDGSGNVYIAGYWSHNAFKITPEGSITEIIDSTGDGTGNTLTSPQGIAVDGSGNVYVVGHGINPNAFNTYNAFKITPGGAITEIIDSTGDGTGNNTLNIPYFVVVDGSDNVYVTGITSSNAFKITPGGAITEIIDSTGDATGNTLDGAAWITVDGSGNVYVTGHYSDNAFKITPGGSITEIIDSSGDGTGNTLHRPTGIEVDGVGNVYVAGHPSNNVFKITPGGVITQILDSSGDGAGNGLISPFFIAVDETDNVYVTGWDSDNVFKITPSGVITQILDSTGDGAGNTLDGPTGIAVDRSGSVYVAGFWNHNAFKIEFAATCNDTDGDGYGSPGDPSCPGGTAEDCNNDDVLINPGAIEICDGVNNNCSGTADDGIADIVTGSDVGECRPEIRSCIGGQFTIVQTTIGPVTEVCDGLDNDCDGALDNDIATVPTSCGVGECSGNTGEVTCENGSLVDSCDPFERASEEICDGADNDCDGDVDEGFDADGDEIADCFDACPFDADNDADGDGVCGDLDVCSDTVIPEGVPTKRLGVNRFALTDADVVFDTTSPGGGKGTGIKFTTGDTAGCSCEQIIEALELGNGHVKFGCSISAMEAWTALVNP